MLASGFRMFSLKFKNFGLADNYMRYLLILSAIVSIVLAGIGGLAWTIGCYVLLSAIPTKGGKG